MLDNNSDNLINENSEILESSKYYLYCLCIYIS